MKTTEQKLIEKQRQLIHILSGCSPSQDDSEYNEYVDKISIIESEIKSLEAELKEEQTEQCPQCGEKMIEIHCPGCGNHFKP